MSIFMMTAGMHFVFVVVVVVVVVVDATRFVSAMSCFYFVSLYNAQERNLICMRRHLTLDMHTASYLSYHVVFDYIIM